mgnify:CR=1 FL=1
MDELVTDDRRGSSEDCETSAMGFFAANRVERTQWKSSTLEDLVQP